MGPSDEAVQAYVDALMTRLWPLLLAHARMCHRLRVEAPTAEDMAQTVIDQWVAARDTSPA